MRRLVIGAGLAGLTAAVLEACQRVGSARDRHPGAARRHPSPPRTPRTPTAVQKPQAISNKATGRGLDRRSDPTGTHYIRLTSCLTDLDMVRLDAILGQRLSPTPL